MGTLKKEVIDEYGRVKDQIKVLDKHKKELETHFTDLSVGSYEGHQYTLIKRTRVEATIDPDKTLKKVGQKTFMKVVKVLKTQLQQFLPTSDIDKISTYKEGYTLSTAKKGE